MRLAGYPMCTGYNIAVRTIASRLFPTGFDTTADETAAPTDLTSLNAQMATGRMLVWTGASEHTIFDDPETNWAFRAWHDWCHWKGQFKFDLTGEDQAVTMQRENLRTVYGDSAQSRLFQRIVTCDILGTFTYRQATGDYPVDQRAFTEALLSAMPPITDDLAVAA